MVDWITVLKSQPSSGNNTLLLPLYSLKKVLFNTKNRRKKFVRSRAKLDSRVQTPDHDPMSYERPHPMKFLFISNFTHAILPIIFAVHT